MSAESTNEVVSSGEHADAVGFIGLGHLGGPMASRLVHAGKQLVVFDLDPSHVEALTRQGALAAGSPREVAERAGVVFSCLPTEDAAREALLGPDGAAHGASADSGFVECSTVSPETAVELATGARAAGAMAIEASVSGSTIPAEHGELVLLVGGDRELFERCEGLFAALARETHYMGASGTGAMTKLVVNTLLGVNMQSLAEAIALGVASGLDRNRFLDVLASNPTVAPAHRPKIENARKDEYPVQFALRLMHKDFGLVIEHAQKVGATMPTTAVAHQMCSAESAKGREEDFSAVIQLMLELSGVPAPVR